MSGIAPPGASIIAADRLQLARRRAARNARLERLWPALLPALGLLGLYLAASLFGWPQALPDWLHLLLLLAVLAAMAGLVRRRLARSPVPPAGLAARLADRRIEQVSGLRHEPLATLADFPAEPAADFPAEPAAGDAGATRALWAAHQARVAASLSMTRAGWPRLGVLRHDPLRLSFGVAAVCLVGLAMAGGHAPGRLLAGLWPGYQDQEGPPPVVQAWIRSPDYAGLAPVFLATGTQGDSQGGEGGEGGATTARVPQGAVLSAIVTGPDRVPSLSGGARVKQLGSRSWALTRTLERSGDLELSASGYDLPRWHIEVVPRAAPVVGWTSPPTPVAGDAPKAGTQPELRLPWHVTHAYGVAGLRAVITPDGDPDGSEAVTVPIPLDGQPRDAHGVADADLAANPLAGGDASVVLRATDGSGATGSSAVARVRLPEHAFRNPLARALQAQRRRLALHPHRAAAIAADLMTLGEAPGVLQTQSDLYLELAAASALVAQSADPYRAAQAPAIRRLAQARLWELALSVEDALGNDRTARAASVALRAAQQAVASQMQHMRELGRAGQDPAEQSELQRRVQALQEAIRRRMQALADQARRQGNAIPMDPRMGGSGVDLQKLMRQMQNDAAEGRSEQAMRELQQMQAMLDRMRAATPRDAAAAAMQAEAAAQASEQAADLHDLIARQTTLLDASSRRAPHADPTANPALQWRQTIENQLDTGSDPDQNQGPDQGSDQGRAPPAAPAPPGPGGRDDAMNQHVLQRATDELAQEFKAFQGTLPQGLTDAGKAMTDARDALRRGDDAAAAAAQTKALADLQQGGQQMRQTMADNSAKAGAGSGEIIPGFGPGGSGDEGSEQAGQDGDDGAGGDRDALGRRLGQGHAGNDDATSTVLPGAQGGARSRALEQELRRRDSDRQRPPAELDYLDRLLKPFAQ